MANNKEAGVKKYQLDKLKVVKVTWLDAMSDDNTWQDLKELEKQSLKSVHCVGWILKEDKKNIILISSLDEDAQTGGGGTVIPKSCVKEIVQLKEGRNGEVYDEPTKH
jgi:hypothetical protein|tara:strand:- start:4264 stop:4587 length:324 start_codon:yes stop_codon:yes gene_type:complete